MRPSLVVRELYEMPVMFLFNTTEFQNPICLHIIKLYLHVAFCTSSLDAYFPFTQGHGRTDWLEYQLMHVGLVWAESSSGRVESHLEETRWVGNGSSIGDLLPFESQELTLTINN